MTSNKSSIFFRPYSKQLSQYCFLTLKNQNNPKINKKKNQEKYKILEKDDKTNIYFNLIKTYYDENGRKLKPKKTEIYPIDIELIYPKIIKSKKKKKSSYKNGNGNCLKYEKKNKTMNNNCNIYLAPIDKKNNHSHLKQKKIIKKEYNNITPLSISSGELIYNSKFKNTATSPTTSEKSFNIFFQNKSHDYIINDIQKNPIIKGNVGNLNINFNIQSTDIKNKEDKIYEFHNNGQKYIDEKKKSDIINYFNKRISHHRKIKTSHMNDPKSLQDLKIYASFSNNKAFQNHRNNINHIFQKKKIYDSFDDTKNVKNKKSIKKYFIRNNQSNSIINYEELLNNSKNKSQRFFFIDKECLNHNNTILSLTKLNTSKNNNNINNMNMTKISPKKLEKYFEPNQFNTKIFSYRTQYLKPQQDKEMIDINNITFKNPFKLIKNKKLDNNTSNEINNTADTNFINDKRIIISHFGNINNKNISKFLSQNISYKNETPNELLKKNEVIDKILKNNNINYSYNIKYMKTKFKQNPYSFSNEKIKILQKLNSFKEKMKSNKNKCDINRNTSHNITEINSYNTRNFINKINIYKCFNTNNYINDSNIENSNYNKQILGLKNKQNNIIHQIPITEPSIIYNKIKINNSIIPQTGNNNINQKVINDKEKNRNKKMYILRRKIKEGVIKFRNKLEIQNKLGIKKGNIS